MHEALKNLNFIVTHGLDGHGEQAGNTTLEGDLQGRIPNRLASFLRRASKPRVRSARWIYPAGFRPEPPPSKARKSQKTDKLTKTVGRPNTDRR